MSSPHPSFSYKWRTAVIQLNQEVALFERNEKSSLLCSSRRGKFTRRRIIGWDSGMECLTRPPRPRVTFMCHRINSEPSAGVISIQDLAKTRNGRNKESLVSSLIALQTLYQNTDNSAGSFFQCLCLLMFQKVQHREDIQAQVVLLRLQISCGKPFLLWKKKLKMHQKW